MNKPRILLVEDEVIIAKDIEMTLKSLGYEIVGRAVSGEEAVKKTVQTHPDLVLMDIRLQGSMSGIDAAVLIRDQSAIPVVFLTSFADEETLRQAKLTEPFGYLLKPHNTRELYSTVEVALLKHKLELELKKSEKKYRTLFETSKDAICIFNEKGDWIDASPSALELLGIESKAQLPLVSLTEAMQGEGTWKKFLKDIHENGFVKNWETQLVDAEGKVIDGLISAAIGKDRKESMIFAIVSDISEKKRLEQQLLWLEKMETVGRLVSGIAHDFNNLLTLILGKCDILEEKLKRGENGLDSVQSIRQAGIHGSHLIRRLSEFSQPRPIRLIPVELNRLIKDLDPFISRLFGKQLKVALRLTPHLPQVLGDPALFEQVLLNLAMNAYDAMGTEGILTIQTAKTILDSGEFQSFRLEENSEYVVLKVKDTGSGMSEETKAHLFEPFYTTKEKGTGLGLATVFRIVTDLSGFIHVESEPEEGSEFSIYFPAFLPEKKDQPASEISEISEEIVRMVVIRSESIPLALMKDRMEQSGVRLHIAPDLEKAEQYISKAGKDVKLFLIDIDLCSDSCILRVKSLEVKFPGMKILFIGKVFQEKLNFPDLVKGDWDILAGPVSPTLLLRKIEGMLREKKRE